MIRRVVSCSLCLLLLFLQLLFACFISLAFCLIAVYHTIPGTTSETPSVRLRVPQRSLLLTFRYHYFCARRGCVYVSSLEMVFVVPHNFGRTRHSIPKTSIDRYYYIAPTFDIPSLPLLITYLHGRKNSAVTAAVKTSSSQSQSQ